MSNRSGVAFVSNDKEKLDTIEKEVKSFKTTCNLSFIRKEDAVVVYISHSMYAEDLYAADSLIYKVCSVVDDVYIEYASDAYIEYVSDGYEIIEDHYTSALESISMDATIIDYDDFIEKYKHTKFSMSYLESGIIDRQTV